MPAPSLLVIGRLALDPDMRTRIAAAAVGRPLTEDLIYAVIRSDGVADTALEVEIGEDHPHGVDSSPIEDAAIIAAVATYTPTTEEN